MIKILWFSANSAGDMCFTSQRELALGLVKNGYSVQFINKDKENSHSGYDWDHVSIEYTDIAGFKASSLGKNMAKWLSRQTISDATVALVDWRLITKLHGQLTDKNIPWILLDRSPPADRGILAKLQWPIWRKAWKLVNKSSNSCGTVVSSGHQKFTMDKNQISSNKFFQIPAGVDLEKFSPGESTGLLRLIYHGRLDKHRGVLALPMLVRKAITAGLDISLKLIGDGDCFSDLQKIASDFDEITVFPTMSTEEVANHLKESTVGILPMPEIDMWAISSPLKRSEYCASGLLIFGIDHNGHRFDGHQKPWMRLVPQYDFHDEGVKWLSGLSQNQISDLSKQSRQFAEENLSWDVSVNSLISAIHFVSEL